MRKALLAGFLALSLGLGCSPRMFQAMILTAAVVGTVAVLAHHDHHFHTDYCGHHRRWHDGRWVYYYDDRWEYYDPDTGRWYYYEEGWY
jgi:hypothetical protein